MTAILWRRHRPPVRPKRFTMFLLDLVWTKKIIFKWDGISPVILFRTLVQARWPAMQALRWDPFLFLTLAKIETGDCLPPTTCRLQEPTPQDLLHKKNGRALVLAQALAINIAWLRAFILGCDWTIQWQHTLRVWLGWLIRRFPTSEPWCIPQSL